MNLELYILLPVLVAICLLTFFLGWYLNARTNRIKLEGAENVAKKIVADAEIKSKETVANAEKRSKELISDAEKASQNLKKEFLISLI